jgi:large subunit ribosomal protein L4
MKLKIYDAKGTATDKSVNLSKDIFEIEPNNHAIYLDVKQHLANKRQGTHKAKERAEIQGSTKKIKKQKGTGGARVGDIKSGIRVGGGRIFGPRPRNYHFKLNVKLKRLARKSAFSVQAKNKSIMVVNDLSSLTTKTKDFKALIASLKIENDKVLFIMNEKNDNAYLSSRNLKKVKVVTADAFNTYDILNASKIIVSSDSIKKIEKLLN